MSTDLGGIGLHDGHPSVSDFVESVFEQLKEGNSELTFGLSDVMANANTQELKETFNRMNL
ncbi:hypothetical protein [Flavobacterium psychrophilum]|uniref:hypothetical protein n=1 Tax=Flavobacterium psychrophilum TaxID=96345 RepID=UPI000B7C3EF1|nr:hypothetical protein [Flavobacterium psychrophilum]EKT4500635.1 hypothetical protein [Flavobacterium psychrophilum]MBF2023692.1 hypothetical protein [Flavobacterium psychrophilum]MCB5984299.1 hypothetical protein [Flavobacterium psychrophilum]MCB5994326.1 hypothetical protein [Flavobacterium psychrophilum]MCB5996467.1 hypothetical protein [Flavobacterium psychrophilum]